MTVRAVLLLSLILVAAPAFGQGTIAGQVTSRSLRGVQLVDVGVPGVTVELFAARSDNAPLRTAVTNADGRYEFHEVPAGPYDVRASANGFVGLRRDGVLVTSGETAIVDLALSLDVRPRVQGGGGLLPPYPIPNDPPLRACLHEGRETPGEARYALVDMRDPCGFSISSESLAGRPSLDQRYRIVPLT